MRVRLIQQTRATLAFEIIDHIGKRGLLEDILADDEGLRCGPMTLAFHFQPVDTLCSKTGEIEGPELPVFPSVDGAGEYRFALEDGGAIGGVDEPETGDTDRRIRLYNGPFCPGILIAHLVGKDMQRLASEHGGQDQC